MLREMKRLQRKALSASLKYKRDMTATTVYVQGRLPLEAQFVEDWLNAKARRDPRLTDIWLGRAERPVAFKRLKTSLRQLLKSEYEVATSKASKVLVAELNRMRFNRET